MTTAETAALAADAVSSMQAAGGDPVLEGVKWFGIALGGVIALAVPVMHFLRKFASDRAATARDSAESALYSNLAEQLNDQKRQLDTVYTAHNALVIEHGRTLARVAKVEEYEATIDTLKESLLVKQQMIDAKDAELQIERQHNRELTMEIIKLKDRIGVLERRIYRGERPLNPEVADA